MIIDYTTHTVLITGASSGIGSEFARALAQRGADLVLVARRLDRLDALADDLRREYDVAVETVRLDLTSPQAATDLHRITRERGIRVTGLINNAGFGTFGPFSTEDLDRLHQEIAVDVVAPMSLSSVFLAELTAARGFLINVASMAAYVPTPRMAVYGATKAFVLSFTEALWTETRGTGLTVFALSPGATGTEFNAVVGTDDATAGARMRTPADVVTTALSHLSRRNPGPSVIDGTGNRVSAVFSRLLSRRGATALMGRITDPARRSR